MQTTYYERDDGLMRMQLPASKMADVCADSLPLAKWRPGAGCQRSQCYPWRTSGCARPATEPMTPRCCEIRAPTLCPTKPRSRSSPELGSINTINTTFVPSVSHFYVYAFACWLAVHFLTQCIWLLQLAVQKLAETGSSLQLELKQIIKQSHYSAYHTQATKTCL